MDHVAENAAARERVLGLARGLSDEALSRPVGDDWTIGAELAHLAFWDRVHVGRLRAAIDQGHAVPPPLPDGLTDIINNGELGTWRRLPGRDAIDIFESASRDVDELRGDARPGHRGGRAGRGDGTARGALPTSARARGRDRAVPLNGRREGAGHLPNAA